MSLCPELRAAGRAGVPISLGKFRRRRRAMLHNSNLVGANKTLDCQNPLNQEDALKWFAELFGLSIDTVSPGTMRTEIPDWDSLGVLTLMAALDETFDLVVDDADMRAMQKVGDVLDLLRKNGRLN